MGGGIARILAAMKGGLRRLRSWSDRRAGWLLVAGAMGIACHQWRQWLRDAALLDRLAVAPEPVEPWESWPQPPLVSVLTAAWNERDVIGDFMASFNCLHYPYRELIICAGGADGTYEAATAFLDGTSTRGSGIGGEPTRLAPPAGNERGHFETHWPATTLADGDLGARSRVDRPGRSGSDPGTPRLATTLEIVVLEQKPGEGKQGALQRCFDQSRGEVLFLTDADCLLDDESFEATLRPILLGHEAVTTGTSRPMTRQLSSLVVRSQLAVDRYVEGHRPRYLSGLLGRNAAVRREALEAAGAFVAPVRTGTDYHLAKRLLAQGYRIRRVDGCGVETRYAETWSERRRQQARWLRNVVVHGVAFGAYGEALRCLVPSAIGVALLSWPLAFPLLGRGAVVVWLLAWVHAVMSRARYVVFAGRIAGYRFGLQDAACLTLFVAHDFATWAIALLDYASGRGRTRW